MKIKRDISYRSINSWQQFSRKMIKCHSLKVPWLSNNQTSLKLRIKWRFRSGIRKNKCNFLHFDGKMPAETMTGTQAPTQVRLGSLWSQIVGNSRCSPTSHPNQFSHGNLNSLYSFKGNVWKIRGNSLDKVRIVWKKKLSLKKNLIAEIFHCSKSARDLGNGQRIADKKAREMLWSSFEVATKLKESSVNMDRFFVFLVVHDDDSANQEGKIILKMRGTMHLLVSSRFSIRNFMPSAQTCLAFYAVLYINFSWFQFISPKYLLNATFEPLV